MGARWGPASVLPITLRTRDPAKTDIPNTPYWESLQTCEVPSLAGRNRAVSEMEISTCACPRFACHLSDVTISVLRIYLSSNDHPSIGCFHSKFR